MKILKSSVARILAHLADPDGNDDDTNVSLFHLLDERPVRRVHLVGPRILENIVPDEADELSRTLDRLGDKPINIWGAENEYTHSADPDEEDRWLNGYEVASTGQFVARPTYEQIPNYLRDADAALQLKHRLFGSDGLVTCVFEGSDEWGSTYTVYLVEPDSGVEFAKATGDILARTLVRACLTALLNNWKHPLGWFEVVED